MDQVNTQLNRGTSAKTIHSGVSGMINFDFALMPFLMFGLRGGYLSCMPGTANYNLLVYNQTTTVNTYLLPAEAGLIANLELPVMPISLLAGMYVGYGFGFASFKNDISALGLSTTFTQPYDGGSVIGELLVRANLRLLAALSVNVNAGYRLAKIAQMKQSQDISFTAIPGITVPVGAKGDVLKDSDNADMAFDYSGFNIGAGVSLDF